MSKFLLIVWFVSAAQGANIVDRIAAVVNDEVIALSEVYDLGKDFVRGRCPTSAPECQAEAELEVLDEIIKRVLVRQELDRLGIRVTGTEIDQAIDQIVSDNSLPDRDQLRREVERTGMPWEAYREQLLEQLQMQRFQQAILGPRLSVTEDEVRDLYQRTVRDVQGELEVSVDGFGVVIPPDAQPWAIEVMEKEVVAIVEQLRSGELTWEKALADHDQAQLSRVLSQKAFRQNELAPALDALVFEAPIGEVQDPVSMGSVIAVVKVIDRAMGRGDVRSLEEARPDIQQRLFEKKLLEAETEWYQLARRQAAVQVLLEAR